MSMTSDWTHLANPLTQPRLVYDHPPGPVEVATAHILLPLDPLGLAGFGLTAEVVLVELGDGNELQWTVRPIKERCERSNSCSSQRPSPYRYDTGGERG